MSNQSLADDLHKLIIKTFRKRKAYSFFRESIWDADLADMQLISKPTKGIRFLLYAIDILLNMHELLLWKSKKLLQSLMHFIFLDVPSSYSKKA